MTLTPLASHSPAAVRDALVKRGMDPNRAEAAAHGLSPVVFVLDGLGVAERELVADASRRHGVACLTGEGWALLAGGVAPLAGLARPGASLLPAVMADAIGAALRGTLEPVTVWRTARGGIGVDRPVVVGILNVTPDSFSDGGHYVDPGAAAEHAEGMVAAGALMLDVGAESTRPGRPEPVSEAEEWARLDPVLRELARRIPHTPISVDTVKRGIAARALDAGAWAINDVSGLRLDLGIADVCAKAGAGLIVMHSRGTVSNMATYDHAHYADVSAEVAREIGAGVALAEGRGVPRDAIVVDPGLGFAKETAHSYAALNGVTVLAATGQPVMVGPSRKRFLGAATGAGVLDRDGATAAACAAAFLLGARLFRVHAVRPVVEALSVVHAIRAA